MLIRLVATFCAVIALFILSSPVMAASYSHGEACATAGAWHGINDSNSMEFLICDGSTWNSTISYYSTSDVRINNGSLEVNQAPAPGAVIFSNDNENAISALSENSFSNSLYAIGFSSTSKYVNGYFDWGSGLFKGVVRTGAYSTFIGDTWDIDDPLPNSSGGIATADGYLRVYVYGNLMMEFDQQSSTMIEAKVPMDLQSGFKLSTDVVAPQITSNQNNYNPASFWGATLLKISSNAARDITGLSATGGGGDGKFIVIQNTGVNIITLKNQSTSSTAANRFSFGQDITLAGDQSITLLYDGTVSRWKTINSTSSIWSRTGGNIFFSSGYVGINDTNPSVALDVVGDIQYTGVLTDVSDVRMKDGIQPIANALEKMQGLHGVSFFMKDDSKQKRELGLIAQDVEKIYPDLVFTSPEGIKSLNYVGMIGPLVEAVKELDAENAELRSRVVDMDKRLKLLEIERPSAAR